MSAVVLALLFSSCDPRWIVGTSEIVEEIGSEDCVRNALNGFEGLADVTLHRHEHRTLTGKVVEDPSSFRFQTEFGPAFLWYGQRGNGKWKIRIAYQDIGFTPPPTMSDDAELLMQGVSEHVLTMCFENDT